MSNQFGVPPPPRPQVLEPGFGTASRPRVDRTDDVDDGPYYVPETDPWRRRAAVLLAFLSVGFLVFANLASWVHFTALSTQAARGTVAAATVDDARGVVALAIAPEVTAAVESAARRASIGQVRNLEPRVAQAVEAGVSSPEFDQSWSAALAQTADRQRALARGAVPTIREQDGVVTEVTLGPLVRPITASLAAQGLTFMSSAPVFLTTYSISTTDTAADHQALLGLPDSWWWVLLLLAIGCGAGAIALASRPLRLATLMAVDAAIMLGGCLILIPLVAQVADDQALDPDQAILLERGFAALTRPLVVQTVTLMAIALLTAIVLHVYSRTRGPADRTEPAA